MRTATAPKHFLQPARRLSLSCLLAMIAIASSGCSLCQPGYLCDYAGVGGKWQRTDPENGRVGSVFSDPNSVVGHSAQPAGVIMDEGHVYQDAEGGQSILDSSMDPPPATEEGVIILGDSW